MDLSQIFGLWLVFAVASLVLVVPNVVRSLCRRFLPARAEEPVVDPVEEVRLAKRKALIAAQLRARPWKGKQSMTEEDKIERGQTAAPDTAAEDVAKANSREDEEHFLECAICLSEFENDQLVCDSNNDGCIHTFHFECTSQWLLKHEGCPICRETYLLEKV